MRSRTIAIAAIAARVLLGADDRGCSSDAATSDRGQHQRRGPEERRDHARRRDDHHRWPAHQGARGRRAQGRRDPHEAVRPVSPGDVPARSTVDGAFLQTYRFKSAAKPRGRRAPSRPTATFSAPRPTQSVNVNWTGWPAFFRSGDLVVIFVTEKEGENAARDKRVYAALKGVFGEPFIGGDTPPASLHTSATPTATGTVPRPAPPRPPAPATSARPQAIARVDRTPPRRHDGQMDHLSGSQRLRATAALIVTVFFWGAAFIAIRAVVAAGVYSPGQLSAARLMVASVLLGVLVAARRGIRIPERHRLPQQVGASCA